MGFLKGLRFRIKILLWRFPLFWKFCYLLMNYNSRHAAKVIHRDSDIVIEGPPRCGNSYNYRVFVYFNDRFNAKQIATHTHSIAQLKLAKKWGIPCLVSIRNPRDAIISSIAHDIHKGNSDMSHDNVKRQLVYRVQYWTKYLAYLKDNLEYFIFVDLDPSNRNLQNALEQLNYTFDESYHLSMQECSLMNEKIRSQIRNKHVLPNVERELIKEFVKDSPVIIDFDWTLIVTKYQDVINACKS